MTGVRAIHVSRYFGHIEMKPFDLEAAKRGEPLVTRDGRSVVSGNGSVVSGNGGAGRRSGDAVSG